MNSRFTPSVQTGTANGWVLDRRDFMRCSSLALAGVFAGCNQLVGSGARRPLRVGLITDLHYADREAKGVRFYRE